VINVFHVQIVKSAIFGKNIKLMKSKYFALLLLTLFSCTYQNNKIDNAGIEKVIYINKDIIVAPGESLVIPKGTTYIFKDTSKIVIEGSLFINGTYEKPVVFKPNDTSSTWGGMLFKGNGSNTALIKNATFNNGRIYSTDFNIHIDSCTFTNNALLDQFDALIRVFRGSVSIENSKFSSNNTGEGCLIHKIVDNLAKVENCMFNQVSDAVEFLGVKNNGFILNNLITNITQPSGDGID